MIRAFSRRPVARETGSEARTVEPKERDRRVDPNPGRVDAGILP